MPVSRWTQVANAVTGFTFDDEAVQVELTKMVRAKLLRSRMINGKRSYEVNY